MMFLFAHALPGGPERTQAVASGRRRSENGAMEVDCRRKCRTHGPKPMVLRKAVRLENRWARKGPVSSNLTAAAFGYAESRMASGIARLPVVD
jgi:hypothetical protein